MIGASRRGLQARAFSPGGDKHGDSGVYRVTEIIGTSTVSWEDAATTAVETAAKSLRDLRVAEVGKLDMKIESGKVVAYRARVTLSFKYEA
jgi:flavin-binding protein dodecin